MPLIPTRLQTNLENGFFGQSSNSFWGKAVSRGVIKGVIDGSTCVVIGVGAAGGGGVATIEGISGISQSTFLSFLKPNFAKLLGLPASSLSATMGLKNIAKIGTELSLMTITAGPYSSVGSGTATVSGIIVDPQVITKEILNEFEKADKNPATRAFIARDEDGVPTEEVLGMQKDMAEAIALTCRDNLAIITGTGSVSGSGAPGPGGPEPQPGTIS